MKRAIVLGAALGLALAGAPACERSGARDPVELAVTPAAMARLEARVETVMNAPEAQRAMDELFEAVAADPELGALAGQLGEQLERDPEISLAATSFISEIGDSPALMTWAVRYMDAHPGTDPAQVGDAVGAEVERRFEAVLMKPIETEIGALFDRVDGAAGITAIEKHVSGQFDRVVDAYFEQPARKARWSKRLVELNGGARPSPARATDLYLDHAWSEERISRFVVRACADPDVRHAVIGLLRRVLGTPALQAHIVRATRTLAVDTELRRAAIDVFALLLVPDVSDDEVDAKVKALFASPALLAAANDIAQHMLAEPALLTILDETLAEVGRRPSVRAALDELCDGW